MELPCSKCDLVNVLYGTRVVVQSPESNRSWKDKLDKTSCEFINERVAFPKIRGLYHLEFCQQLQSQQLKLELGESKEKLWHQHLGSRTWRSWPQFRLQKTWILQSMCWWEAVSK